MTKGESCDTITVTRVPKFTYDSVSGRAAIRTSEGDEIQFRVRDGQMYFWSKRHRREYGFPLEDVIELITE